MVGLMIEEYFAGFLGQGQAKCVWQWQCKLLTNVVVKTFVFMMWNIVEMPHLLQKMLIFVHVIIFCPIKANNSKRRCYAII